MDSKGIKANKLIHDLVMFYVKENYNNYLEEKKISFIPENEVEAVVNNIYIGRKTHLKKFIISSMKEIMKEEYIGDLFINNILIEVFRDDQLCKNRIILEIKEFQKNKN